MPNLGPTQNNGLISLHYLNINSLVRKEPLLRDLIEEKFCDLLVLSETKLKADDTDFTRYGALPEHYSGCFQDRTSDTRGGGLAVIFRDSLQVRNKTAEFSCSTSFELMLVNICDKSGSITLANIYHLPNSSLIAFFEELTDLVQELTLSGMRWIIGGDLNCPGISSNDS